MSIELKEISKRYGSQQVLDNVNLSVKTGEIVGFLGPNGAGKSTTMRIITGYIQPDSGSVWVGGINALKDPIAARRLIGYLPENNPLYLDMYVKEYLYFVAGVYGLGKEKKARVEQIIEQTGLTEEYKKKVGQLSKGYRQRVGLAQALVHDPQVLILDEPTTGLDPNQLVEVRDLIRSLGQQKTVMLSTHIMQEVTAICQRVVIINKGRIVADENDPNNLARRLSDRLYTYAEFDKVIDRSLWEMVPGVINATEVKPLFWQLESDTDIRPDVFRFAVDNRLTLLTLQLQEKDMEDIFREVTK